MAQEKRVAAAVVHDRSVKDFCEARLGNLCFVTISGSFHFRRP